MTAVTLALLERLERVIRFCSLHINLQGHDTRKYIQSTETQTETETEAPINSLADLPSLDDLKAEITHYAALQSSLEETSSRVRGS